jgi:heat shock 70kDa protein 4
MPLIQKYLSQNINKTLSYLLNSDEAIALGSAFHAASLSPLFRVRTYEINDIQPYQINFQLLPNKRVSSKFNILKKEHKLYKENDIFDSKKTVTVPREEDFDISLSYDKTEEEIGTFQIRKVKEKLEELKPDEEKLNKEKGYKKFINVIFKTNKLGMIEVESAQAIMEEHQNTEKKTKKQGSQGPDVGEDKKEVIVEKVTTTKALEVLFVPVLLYLTKK